MRDKLKDTRRWVIKIGSALLTNDGRGLDLQAIGDWVEQMVGVRQQGVELLLVSSGAVAKLPPPVWICWTSLTELNV